MSTMLYTGKGADCKSVPHRLIINMERGQNKYGKLKEPEEREPSSSKQKDLEFEELEAFESKLAKYLKYFCAIALIAIFITMGYLLWSNYHARRSVIVRSDPTLDIQKSFWGNKPDARPEEEAIPVNNPPVFISDTSGLFPGPFFNIFDKDSEHSQVHLKIAFIPEGLDPGTFDKEVGSGDADVQNSMPDDIPKINNRVVHFLFILRKSGENKIDDVSSQVFPEASVDSASLRIEPTKGEKKEASD